jgi:hypothetical protein
VRRALDAALVGALALLAAAMAPLAALIVDSGRDLAIAYATEQGFEFPLYGPSLFGLWRPGPVWFYLLAVPLKLFGSVGAAAAFAGVLAAMKVPLAWSFGRRARDAAFGLAFAAFVALPGWVTLAQLVVSHTVLVEAGVLATLWLCLASAQRGSARLAALAMVMQALAIHAHPTALVAAPAVAWVVWTTILRPRGAQPAGTGGFTTEAGELAPPTPTAGIGARASQVRWGWLLASMVLFALPFVPALVAEARAGFPQFGGSAGYFAGGDYLARLDRIDDVLLGAVYGQAQLVRDFLLARWPPLAWLVFAGGLLATTIGALGAVLGLTRDRLLPPLLGLAIFGWLFVLLLRDATPAWMAYAPLVVQAGLLAAGWQWVWPARWRTHAARGLALFALLAGGALLAERIATVRAGTQYLPTASVADIAVPPQRDPPVRFWLPAYAHDALLRRLCAAPGAVSLHGDLATALHFGQGVAAALHCADAARIGFGGQAPRTLAGVPRGVAQELGIAGETTGWGYVLATPVRVLHPATALPLATHTRYLVDDYLARIGHDAPTVLPVRSACGPGELLVVTDLLPGLNLPFEIRAADEALPPLRAQTIASRYFGCPDSGSLSLEVVALDAQAVGIVLLRGAR